MCRRPACPDYDNEVRTDGRMLELRVEKPGRLEWVTSYTYYADGRLLKTVSGKAGSAADSQTTYLYDDARRLVGVESGDNVKGDYQVRREGTEVHHRKL